MASLRALAGRLVPEPVKAAVEGARFRRRFERAPLPFAFIVGPAHSGTTLLARILSEHSALHVPSDETRAFVAGPARAWRQIAGLAAEARSVGKAMVVEKTPRHVLVMDDIRRALPGARFVLTMRDGRDVTASIGRRFDGDFDRGVRWWARAATRVAAEADAPDALLSRYEDLVTDPKAAIAAICAFLGVPDEPQLHDFHTRPKSWGHAAAVGADTPPGYRAHAERRQQQVNTPVYDGRGAWRGVLPDAFAARFSEEPQRSLMRRFGYAG